MAMAAGGAATGSSKQLNSDRKGSREGPPPQTHHVHAQHLSKVSRTKSLKMKILGQDGEQHEEHMAPLSAPIPGSSEPSASPPLASQVSTTATKTNIREKLRKFFLRRPTMEDLFRRGIMRSEPVFGSTLRELRQSEGGAQWPEWSPAFVRRCVEEIERGDRMDTDGVYRQSGNLSHVQKIRLRVDQGDVDVLAACDDVHVLTGALKLFFRELREPLIPWECVSGLLAASQQCNGQRRARHLRDIVRDGVPQTHRPTLALLLKHLLRVTERSEFNRMQVMKM